VWFFSVFPGMAQVQAGLAAATAASFQAWSVNPAALPLQAMVFFFLLLYICFLFLFIMLLLLLFILF
jgi:hypothetical protein